MRKLNRAGLVAALAGIFALTGILPAQAAQTLVVPLSTGSDWTWTLGDFDFNEITTTNPTIGTHSDGFDGDLVLSVCSNDLCTTQTGSYTSYTQVGTYTSSTQIYQGPEIAINGLNVSQQIRISKTIGAGRMISTFTNPAGTPITRVVRYYSNLGSDSSSYLKYTSDLQTLSNQSLPRTGATSLWSIMSDTAGTVGNETAGDPIISKVYGTAGASITPVSDFLNGQSFTTFTLTIPANSTVRLMFIVGVGEINTTLNSHAGALSGLKTYLDSYSKLPADLTNDIDGATLATIRNWVVAPSVTSFTSSQATPTNTSSSINFSLSVSESITGLAASDFSNSGTASGCSFAPNASSGSTFTITVSGCGEGTLRPQLLANSVTGTQAGPGINSPASTTIVIDRTAPTISSVTTSNGNFSSALNPNLNLVVNFSESVTVSGTPRIPLTIGTSTEYATFLSMTDSRTATFRFPVIVDYNDIDLDGITVNSPLELNSGTILDLATNAIVSTTFTSPVTTSVNVYQPPSAPVIDSITANNTSLTINFTAGAANGSIVSNYKYSLNGGAFTALSPTDATSPITITGLTNGTSYAIQIRAVSNLGDGLVSNTMSQAPTASATVSIFLTASATTAVKGTVITITANVNQAGLITFFWNGKRISGCIKKSATTSATCQWKPSTTGQWSIQALLDPTDPTYVDSFSQKLPVFILSRSGRR